MLHGLAVARNYTDIVLQTLNPTKIIINMREWENGKYTALCVGR